MNSKGQDDRQHDHQQQRTASKLNPYRRLSGRIPTLVVIILVGMLLSAIIWYVARQRQVFILTDPVWKAAYLEPEHGEEQLKINLLNRLYIPRIVSIPFEQAGQAEIEAICRSRKGAWFLLSPYFSSLIEPAKLLQSCSDSNLVVWETRAGSGIDSQDALTSTLPPDLASRLTVLYLDPQRLAQAMAVGLEPLISSSESSSESKDRLIQLVWSRNGRFSEDFVLDVQAEIIAQLPSLEVKLVDVREQQGDELNRDDSVGEGNSLEITSEALVLVLDGEPEELQEMLTRIENRGARAVVFGDGALKGWPTGAEAEVSINTKTTFNELMKHASELPAQAPVRRFAVRFQVRR
ncbi:MAG: hypothetical protein R6V86_06550 [Spirochaetia bacterium]